VAVAHTERSCSRLLVSDQRFRLLRVPLEVLGQTRAAAMVVTVALAAILLSERF
jgi:hypothetical protein